MNNVNLEDTFKEIVDQSLKLTLNQDFDSILNRHNLYKIDVKNTSQLKAILKGRLKENFTNVGELDWYDINNLKNQFSYEQLVFHADKPLSINLKILTIIKAFIKADDKFPSLDNRTWWIKFIVLIIDYVEIDYESYHSLTFTDKVEIESKAVKYWIDAGYNITIQNGKIQLNDAIYQKLATIVENKLNSLGGYNVLSEILKRIKYDQESERYLFIRNEEYLAIPYGYLINLCVKNFNNLNHKRIDQFYKGLDELLLMSKNYIALLQLQSFNKYAYILVNQNNFIEYLLNNILIDKIINFKQFDPHLVPNLIKGLLGDLYNQYNLKNVLGIDLETLLSLIEFMLNHNITSHEFKYFNITELEKQFKSLDKRKILKVLDFFSHKLKKINTKFLLPNDLTNYEFKPLIQKGSNYILVDRNINSIAFYEALCNLMRKYISDFDSILGIKLEDYIKSELKVKNISYNCGYYNKNEECDLIIESDKYIFLIEIKKKALTQKALSGDNSKMFDDLSKGLLSSQIQLGKREIELLKNGKIDLYEKKGNKGKDNPLIHTVKWNNKIIERISLNAWDYGVMNDNVFAKTILIFLTGIQLEPFDKERSNELNDINNKSTKLHEQFEIISKLPQPKVPSNYRELYFDSSFISLPLFLFKLRKVDGNEEFASSMEKLKYITFGTGDHYFEYNYWKKENVEN